MLSTTHAASVLGTSNSTSEIYHAVPEKKSKKEKFQKKEKMSKKQVFKKLLGGGGISSLLAILLCIFISPLSFLWVGLYTGWEGSAWLITLLLTLLFILPGVIYAIIVIASN
jgi:uncharacterized membrane protein YqaE (UPF0057 family)